MLLLSLILLVVSILAMIYAGIWSIVQAFCRHVLWGLAVLFVPFANLLFLIVAWSDAKRPFFLYLLSGALCMGSVFMMPKDELENYVKNSPRLQEGIIQALMRFGKPEPAPKAPQGEPSYEEKMAALHAREQDILARKSRLQPGDHAGAEALNREIADYNAARQALLGK
ncbi:MAG TPA: hypothetical protein VGO11_21265 [Chthoniobacteraceae bacterium]|nr:hypothetical protein [Chthoniobacteraceae bacterium]